MIVVLCNDCLELLHEVANGSPETFEAKLPCARRQACPNWTDAEPIPADIDTQLGFQHLAELRKAG